MAIPALAVLADALAILLYVLGWAVALGLLYTWNATFHRLFQLIASALTFHVDIWKFHKSFDLGWWAGSIDTAARNFLSAWAEGSELMVGKLMHALGWIWGAMVRETAALAQDTMSFAYWMRHLFVPHAIAAATAPLKRQGDAAAAKAAQAAAAASTAKKQAHAASNAAADSASAAKATATHAQTTADHAKTEAHKTAAVAAHAPVITVALPGLASLPIPFGRTWSNIKKRLRSVEGLLGATALSVAMANVLGLASPRCLTKGNIGRLSRFICGMDSALLGALLSGLFEAMVVSDLCTFAAALEEAVGGIKPALRAFADVENELLQCPHASFPVKLTVPDLDLPTSPPLLSLAA